MNFKFNVNVRRIVFIISLITLLVCLILIITTLATKKGNNIAVTGGGQITPGNITVSLSKPTLPTVSTNLNETAKILPKWAERHEQNNHFVGWMKLGNTKLDYPVVQYLEPEFDGNTYYLNRGFDKKYSDNGSVYVDWHTPIVDKRRPDNAVVYGHNMNSGEKFATLVRYFSTPNGRSLDAYLTDPTIEFSTVYDDERSTYKIFAAMYVNTEEIHGEVFNYFRQRFFNSKSEFYDFIGKVMDRSVFYTDVDLQYGDELLTLSTCYFPLGGNTDRFVVFARRVRAGESEKVDTSVAYINPSPLYFDHYYKVRGGSWAGRKWDTSKVKGFDEFYSTGANAIRRS